MATHPGMLVAYDAAGNVMATLDYLVQYDEDGTPLGLVDFAGHEEAGGEALDIWGPVHADEEDGTVVLAKGSKVWPEYIGGEIVNFRVELVGPPGNKRIGALVHKQSGHRRERAAVESAIAGRIAAAGNAPADIRDLVGGPDRPLLLDGEGRTAARPKGERPQLPLIRQRSQPDRSQGAAPGE